MSVPSSALASTQHALSDNMRPLASFAPSLWGDTFLQYASQSKEVSDDVKKQALMLKEEVKMIIESSNQNIIQKLNFIDCIQRFGISYHFPKEINQALEQIHSTYTENNAITHEDDNTHFLALLFRLLRQQGYQISSSVFNKLKNDHGVFNESLATDIQGLCNLYEASHLRTLEDDILEEAYDFSKIQLMSLANQLSPSLTAQVNHCLRKPLNKNVPRFEARCHMTLYEQDPSHNETLLTFARVDFNILQKMHQKEISSITKWWKKSNIETKVPYARERLVEAYMWALAMSCKPEYSNARMLAAKLITVVSLLDDTYDAYGTIEELELFTEAIQRWNKSPIESLPHCMKVVFDTVVEMCDEIELATIESGKSILVVPHFKQAVLNLVKGYLVEAKWCQENYIPTYNEYKVNGISTSCFGVFISSFIGLALGEFATEDVFNWIFNDPKIIEAASTIGRILDDMASHEFEQQRVHVASAVECCMKQYGISQEEAYKLIGNDVEEQWKIINEEYLKSNDIPKSVLDCVVDLVRICEVSYENKQDKYTNGVLFKDYVTSLLIEPISLDQK